MKTRIILFLTLIGLVYLSTACKHQQAVVPLKQLWVTSGKNNDTLIIFLPGVRDNKEDFLDKGMFAQPREAALKTNMVAADLNLAYLQNGTGTERLHEDIIAPAHNRGYKNIWLVGISLGGLNALLYLKNRPDDICGVILLSPFLGENGISNSIIQAGGIEHWQPANRDKPDDEEALWLWLKKARLNSVFLGAGTADRFFPLHKQLAQLLPDKNIHFIDGGHRWPVWQKLWQYFTLYFQQNDHFERCQASPIIPSPYSVF